jgi:hypothetical protein
MHMCGHFSAAARRAAYRNGETRHWMCYAPIVAVGATVLGGYMWLLQDQATKRALAYAKYTTAMRTQQYEGSFRSKLLDWEKK